MKQPETQLNLRYAEAEHLLYALSLVPKEKTNEIIHTALIKTISGIKEKWVQEERMRKAKQQARAKKV